MTLVPNYKIMAINYMGNHAHIWLVLGSLAGYSPWGCKESDMTEVTEHVGITPHHCPEIQIRDQKLREVE